MRSDSSRHSDAYETGVVTKRSAGRGSVGLTERLAATSPRSLRTSARVLIDTGAGHRPCGHAAAGSASPAAVPLNFWLALSVSGRSFELVRWESAGVDAGAAPGFEFGERSGEVVADGRDDRCVLLVGVVFDGCSSLLACSSQVGAGKPAASAQGLGGFFDRRRAPASGSGVAAQLSWTELFFGTAWLPGPAADLCPRTPTARPLLRRRVGEALRAADASYWVHGAPYHRCRFPPGTLADRVQHPLPKSVSEG
jgi:hypothetical protein